MLTTNVGAAAHGVEDGTAAELVQELVAEVAKIRQSSGVGSPEIAKHVQAWQPPSGPVAAASSKATLLRSLAVQLYSRRPLLYLRGSPEPLPASVLLRSSRKPSLAALSRGVGSTSLFKAPDNALVVIKFDARFGFADILVDPFFLDAFQQQPSTPTYDKLLASLPRAFVGTAPELKQLVALLTAQSIRAYTDNAASVPPWRRFDAMLARWLPKAFDDQELTQQHAQAAAAGAPWPTTNAGPVTATTSFGAVGSGSSTSSFAAAAATASTDSATSTGSSGSGSAGVGVVGAASVPVWPRVVRGFTVSPEASFSSAASSSSDKQQQQEQQEESELKAQAVAEAVVVAAGVQSADGQESEPLSEVSEDAEESTDSADSDFEPAAAAVDDAPALPAPKETVAVAAPAVAAAAADADGAVSAAVAEAAREAEAWIEGFKASKPVSSSSSNSAAAAGCHAVPQVGSFSFQALSSSLQLGGGIAHQRVCRGCVGQPAAGGDVSSNGSSTDQDNPTTRGSNSRRRASRSDCESHSTRAASRLLTPAARSNSQAGVVLRRAAAALPGSSAAPSSAGGSGGGSICVVKLSGAAAAAAVKAQKQHQQAAAAVGRCSGARDLTAEGSGGGDGAGGSGWGGVSAAQLQAAFIEQLRVRVSEWEGLDGSGGGGSSKDRVSAEKSQQQQGTARKAGGVPGGSGVGVVIGSSTRGVAGGGMGSSWSFGLGVCKLLSSSVSGRMCLGIG